MHYIILGDLRVHNLCAAKSIARSIPGSCTILISRSLLRHPECFDIQNKCIRFILFYAYQIIFGVSVIDYSPIDFNDARSYPGFLSSLVSKLNNSSPNVDINSRECRDCWHNVSGALAMARFLIDHNAEAVSVFNGRISSIQPLISVISSKDICINYFEYSKVPGRFRLQGYSVHDNAVAARNILAMITTDFFPESAIHDIRKLLTLRARIENNYAQRYSEKIDEIYEVAIFLSSPHEAKYALAANYKSPEELIEEYGEIFLRPGIKACLRLHPNVSRDGARHEIDAALHPLCEKYGIEYMGADPEIDSYSIIRNARVVITDRSTICIFAFLEGKEVHVDKESSFFPLLYEAKDMRDRGCPESEIHEFIDKFLFVYDRLNSIPFPGDILLSYRFFRWLDKR